MEFLVKSGIWVALCAVSLLIAAAQSMGIQPGVDLIGVTGLGTISVYSFDRWTADRARWLQWTIPGIAAVFFGLRLPTPAILILAAVCALAFLHSRLRQFAWVKPLYIASAWLGVVVGLPWVMRGPGPIPTVALPIALAIVANVLACDAVDREAEAAQLSPKHVWWIARGIALLGIATGFPHPAAFIPAAMLLAMSRWPVQRWWSERVLDGALLAGSALALAINS